MLKLRSVQKKIFVNLVRLELVRDPRSQKILQKDISENMPKILKMWSALMILMKRIFSGSCGALQEKGYKCLYQDLKEFYEGLWNSKFDRRYIWKKASYGMVDVEDEARFANGPSNLLLNFLICIEGDRSSKLFV